MSKTADTKPLALAYVRVSTGRQAEQGHSVDSQPVILIKAAELAGYRVEVITEVGSGRKGARPALVAALARLKAGEAQALYAVDIDRLGRSTQHVIEIANTAKRQSWRLVVTTADVDTSTIQGELFFTMLAAFAQYESGMVSERVKRQHEARRNRGAVWGVTEGPRSSLPETTINQIVNLRAQGATMQAIADTLKAEGIPTARGGVWQPATVKAVLDSPAVRHAQGVSA
jgi:DNA invertase Pin-like site-specific DNA recombinase